MENNYLVFKEFLKRREERHQQQVKAEMVEAKASVENSQANFKKYENEDLSKISPIALDLLGLRR